MRSIILFVSFFILCGCVKRNTQDIVRQKALQRDSETELNGIIEYYSQCYYKLPDNLEQIISFLEEWKEQAPDSFLWDNYYEASGRTIIDILKKEQYQTSFYTDSIFIYYPKNDIGTCVYGHPAYWIAHPEEFPAERMDYYSFFMPAAYDSNNNYLFRVNTRSIDKQIQSLSKDFHFIAISEKKITPYYGILKERYIPELVICKYDSTSDSLLIKTPLPQKVIMMDKQTEEKKIVKDADFSEYFIKLKEAIRKIVFENPAISRLLFTTRLYS